MERYGTCKQCQGSGLLVDGPCGICDGSGYSGDPWVKYNQMIQEDQETNPINIEEKEGRL